MKPVLLLWAVILMGVLACAEKKPPGPPPELLTQIQAAEAEARRAAGYQPENDLATRYEERLARAKELLEGGDYAAALEEARRAELEAVRVQGEMMFRALLRSNPSPSLTYDYRQSVKKSEEAERAGDLAGAIVYARQARDEIQKVSSRQSTCQQEMEKELDRIAAELEKLYRPSYRMITAYWDAREAFNRETCERLSQRVAELQQQIELFKRTTISTTPVFIVSASPEYVKQYGYPWLYRWITEDGYLTGRIVQVPPGTAVTFIRSRLFSREKTFYWVRDPATGAEGWMAEERVWPERKQE